MTFPENIQNCNQDKDKNLMDISAALKGALLQAHKQGRITTGAYECAKQMQMFPEKVMFCVLSVDQEGDAMIQMEHILLEAYCREHHIGVVKVDSSEKLRNLLVNEKKKGKRNKNGGDYSCALVERPRGDALFGEELVFVDLHRTLTYKQTIPLVVDIPV